MALPYASACPHYPQLDQICIFPHWHLPHSEDHQTDTDLYLGTELLLETQAASDLQTNLYPEINIKYMQ